MAGHRSNMPRPFSDLMSTLAATGFRRVYETEWLVHLEKPPVRVSLRGEYGASGVYWLLEVTETRPNDFLFAPSYSIDTWASFLTGNTVARSAGPESTQAAALLEHLPAIESALAPDSADATLAAMDAVSRLQLRAVLTDEQWADYERSEQEIAERRLEGDAWMLERDLYRLRGWLEAVGTVSIAFPPGWAGPPSLDGVHVVEASLERTSMILKFDRGVALELVSPTGVTVRARRLSIRGFTRVSVMREGPHPRGRSSLGSKSVVHEAFSRDEEIRFIPADLSREEAAVMGD